MPLQKDEKTIEFIKTLRKLKQDFTVINSGSGTKVNWNDKEFNFQLRPLSRKVFIAKSMIQKDVLTTDTDIFTKMLGHKITFNQYYGNSPAIKQGEFQDLTLVDINSAYITALKNSKLITEKTFNYASSLDKMDRLISVGMFAKRSEFREYKEGKKVDHYEINAPYRNIYFYSAYLIDVVMNEIAEALGQDYLFYWFDGVYIYPTQKALRLTAEILKKFHYKFKVEQLRNIKISSEFPKNEFIFEKYEPKKDSWRPYHFEFGDVHIKQLLNIRFCEIMDKKLELL